ncbi:MAG: cobalamin B12-binding domain-containing protein, partial [Deltaproteobacteria bacterium]|nr:cobalamin B12-binding domain-containing protein [Deltaproteobacteria bacterium]
MNILFVVPYHSFGIDKELGMNQKGPPLGIAYLHAFMKQNGVKSRIFDARVYKKPLSALKETINEFSPDLVGINIHCTSEMDDGAFLADKIKEIRGNIKIVVGGSHPSALPEDTLIRYRSIDFVVFGEGELTLLELVRAIENSA